jgi:AcrR family transcriptional regulator
MGKIVQTGTASRDRFLPTPPQRRQAIVRAESILDALDRLLLAQDSGEVGLPAIAREARIPLSSIYHLFPTTEAAYTGLVRRYNARMDRELDALLDGPLPDVWQDIARTLLTAVRAFYARHPVLARLALRPVPYGAARASDDSHIEELAARFAAEIGRRFHAPYVPALETRLAIAMAINDRVWSLGLDDDGTISDFLFDESVRAVLGYVGNFLPPCLAPKLATGG